MRGYIRKRSNSSYSITISSGKDPLTGKRKQYFFSVKGSKKDAQIFLTEKLNELDRGKLIRPSKMTLTELLENWLDNYIKTNDKITTYENYSTVIRNHMGEIGKLRLGLLQPIHFQNLYSQKLKDGGRADGKNGGLSKRSVRLIYTILREALEYAKKLKIIAENPILSTMPPTAEKREPKVWTVDQIVRFLEVAQGMRYGTLFETALKTGLRRGEILPLTWSDIDMNNAVLSINKTLVMTKQGLQVQSPKTKHSIRDVTLPETVVETLLLHREEQTREKSLAGKKYADRGLVFCTKTGNYINPRNLMRRYYYPAIAAAGVPKITFHSLRHTHVTFLLENGENIQAVAERVGHADPGFTVKTYGKPYRETQRKIAANIDWIIPGPSSQ